MNKPTKAKATKTVTTKELLRVCVRCADCAKGTVDPALRQLFVLWASPATATEEPEAGVDQAAQSRFALAKTDDGGFLSPLFAETEASPTKTIPVASGVKYRFYFIRHPDRDYVRGLAERLNKALTVPDELKKFVAEFGEARELEAKVDKLVIRKKKVSCLIFEIPESPDWFVPRGSDLYDGWVLFRGMPGSGILLPDISDRKKAHLQCPKITEQVRRLQYHLGALRYPIGNHRHPYMPEPWVKGKDGVKPLYPNEGMFDEVTWNGVIRFQRDVQAGTAATLDSDKPRKATLAAGSYDPEPNPVERELSDSLAYITSERLALQTKPTLAHISVVDKQTGDAVRDWLDKELRQPSNILVCLGRLDEWLHEDAYDSLSAFSSELKRLGFRAGVNLNNGLRDVRMSVEKVSPGQVKTSIHKSGFAFDFAMHEFRAPRKSAPLFYTPDGGAAAVKRVREGTQHMRWVVYALVRRSDVRADPLPAYAEYVDRIDHWVYDSSHPDGGAMQPITAYDAARETTLWDARATADTYAFLNFTRVAEEGGFGLTRISAHAGGWQRVRPPEVMKSTDLASFAAIVSRIGAHVTEAAMKFAPTGDEIRIADQTYRLQTASADLKKLSEYFAKWLVLTGPTGASLSLRVESWTRPGASIIKGLQGKKLKGLTADVIPEDASGKPGKRERITLGPDANFPGFYAFYVEPVPPLPVDIGTEVSFPALPGHPAHMEWWHYQYVAGYKSKKWSDILYSVGWTHEGLTYVGSLRGGDGTPPGIYGFQGLRYTQADLDREAR